MKEKSICVRICGLKLVVVFGWTGEAILISSDGVSLALRLVKRIARFALVCMENACENIGDLVDIEGGIT